MAQSATGAQKDAIKAQNAAATAAQNQREESQALDYFNAMDNFYLRQSADLQNKTLSDQIQRDDFESSVELLDRQNEAALQSFDLSESNYREQLLVNQSDADIGRGQLERAYDEAITSTAFQIEDQNRAYLTELDQASFRTDEINRQQAENLSQLNLQNRQDDLAINRAYDQLGIRSQQRDLDANRQSGILQEDREDINSQRQQILDTRQQADLMRLNQEAAVDLEDVRSEINRDSQLSNIAFGKQQERIKAITSTGQAAARGRQGVSSARTLQTTLALTGLNTARLTNQAFFAQREFDANTAGSDLKRDAIGIQDQINKIAETGQLKQLDTQTNRLAIQDTYDSASRNLQSSADFIAETRIAEESTLLSDLALDRFDSQDAQAKQQLDEIAYAIGLSAEQLTMNKTRLGESLKSQVASIDDQLLQLEQNKYKADYNAHAARMLPPEFAPDIKAPYDVPLPEYIEPRPGAAPAPAYQATYIPPPQQSDLSKGLMYAGIGASIAAIPFTLGSSAMLAGGATAGTSFGVGSLTVGTAAGLGTGLGTTGGLLTQLSRQTYNTRL